MAGVRQADFRPKLLFYYLQDIMEVKSFLQGQNDFSLLTNFETLDGKFARATMRRPGEGRRACACYVTRTFFFRTLCYCHHSTY